MRRSLVTLVFALAAVVFVLLAGDSEDEAAPPSAVGMMAQNAVAQPMEALPAVELPEIESADSVPLGPELMKALRNVRASPETVSTWSNSFDVDRERLPCSLFVIDEFERPVAGARIEVRGEEAPEEASGGFDTPRIVHKTYPPVGPILLETDDDGRCDVVPPKYSPSVLVEKEGVGSSGWVMLGWNKARSPQVQQLVIPLLRPAHFRGRVLRADGVPVPGIAVEVSSPTVPGAAPRAPQSLVADADGRFALDGDGQGLWRFSVREGTVEVRSGHFRAFPESVQEFELRFPASWHVRGRVVPPAGAPAPAFGGQSVALRRSSPDATDYAESAKLDADGRFDIVVRRPAKASLVTCVGAWGLATPFAVTVDADHPDAEVELTLDQPGRIEGRVVDERGRPVAAAKVRALSASVSRKVSLDGGAADAVLNGALETTAGLDGTFTLAPLRQSGLYDVFAYVGDEELKRTLCAPGVRPGGSAVLMQLGGAQESSASLIIDVVDAASGRPIHGVRAWSATRQPDGSWGNAAQSHSEDSPGRIVVAGRRPGAELCLSVSAKGYDTGCVQEVATVAGTFVRVELHALATLDVTVTAAGAPAAWAAVARTSPRVDCDRKIWSTADAEKATRADAAGHVHLAEIPPGRHVITIAHGERLERREVDLGPGAAAVLDVDLR
jgi:hypothetical protein